MQTPVELLINGRTTIQDQFSRVSEGWLSVRALNPIHSGSNKSLYLRKEAVFDCKGRPA